MRIWLINPFDELPGEGAEQRYACLARHLADRGHDVIWISAGFHHRKKKVRTDECRVARRTPPGDCGSRISEFGVESRSEDVAEESDEGRVARRTPPGDCVSRISEFGVESRSEDVAEKSDGGRVARRTPPRGISSRPKDSAAIRLISAPPYRSNTSLKRLWSHRVWAARVRATLLREVKSGKLAPPDLILASTPPLEGAAAAIRMGKRLKAKVIVDVMDLWPENWLHLFPSAPAAQRLGRFLLAPWFGMSRSIFRKADALCAQSRAFAEYAEATRRPHSRAHVCYLGASAPARPPPAPQNSADPFHMVYIGAMGDFYDIGTVLEAMVLATERGRNWRLTLAGTDPGGRWSRRVAEQGLESRVSLPGFLAAEELEELLNDARVGLIPMKPSSAVAVPYKACQYLAHGLPVLSSLPGELEAALRETGAGRSFLCGDAEDLFRQLDEMANDPGGLLRAGAAARALFRDRFDREMIYPRWAEWMEDVGRG